MNSRDFDQLLDSIRAEDPGAEVTAQAADRVRARLTYPAPSSAAVFYPRKRRPFLRWAVAAALIVAAGVTLPSVLDRVLAPSGPRATVSLVDGKLFRVSSAMTELAPGSPIGENEEIRTAKGARAVIRLTDGSSIELAERTDLTLSERWRGKTVRLERGAVLVEAAKQRRGRLEVSTPDCLISVKGTIFGVSRGTKGSRVSVIEGEVKVDQEGVSHLLHKGDQTVTNVAVANTSVAEDVSWSRNAAKYLPLLAVFAAIPTPGLRYQSKLAEWVPENTAIFASIPNLEPALAEAAKIFEDRVKQSPALSARWNDERSEKLRQIINRVRVLSSYLGDEIVLAVPEVNGHLEEPILVAEARRPGLRDWQTIQGNVVALSSHPVKVSEGAFLATPFGARIAQSYQSGAGWLFAANMEQIVPANVQAEGGNVRFLVIERKQNLGRTENLAALTFSGERKGIASWLGSPGPMGSLDFVSPEATIAASLVVNAPGKLVQELLPANLQDVSEALGGEVTVAVDGPLLPTPSWKVVVEIDNPTRLQTSIERMVRTDADVRFTNQQVNGLTYYELTSPKWRFAVNYVFIDGYLLLAPSRALLTTAIRNRAAGIMLSRSAAFRAQLPKDGHVNFSGLLYGDPGPASDLLKAIGLTTRPEPTLIYAYGEPDRIVAASRGGFFGLGLDTLVALNAKGAAGLRQLLPPVFDQTHATRN